MSSTQLPKAVTTLTAANNPSIAAVAAARSQGGYKIIEPCSPPPIKADAIDEILSCFLIWILPAFFLSGIIVLGTMLISHTIVMRIPLPRLFTLIIVILFAVLITITFFLLMAFHFRRSQRRIRSKRVRFTLSEVCFLSLPLFPLPANRQPLAQTRFKLLLICRIRPPLSPEKVFLDLLGASLIARRRKSRKSRC